eukprot:g32489.t1
MSHQGSDGAMRVPSLACPPLEPTEQIFVEAKGFQFDPPNFLHGMVICMCLIGDVGFNISFNRCCSSERLFKALGRIKRGNLEQCIILLGN